jgi:biotin carboxylase
VVARDPGSQRKRLLVLGAGPAQLGLLQAARRRDLFVIACDRDPAAPGFAYVDRRAIVSTEDEVGIERLADAERVHGVIAPGIDWPVAVAARIADRLALPHAITPESAVLATSKLRQRDALARAGVPQPRWKLVTDADEKFGFPCVVKAPDRQGQKGLTLVETPDELPAAIERARAAARNGLCLLEELVDGPEVTVNAFSVDGEFVPLTVTDRLVAEPPAFGVALAHAWPSTSARFHGGEAGVVAVARRAVEALGIRNGPSYTQLRIAAEGPKVVEVAARLGGGHDAELCEAALGIDENALALAAALGEPLELPRPEPQVGGACVLFLVPPPGALATTEGVAAAEAVAGVLDVRLYRSPGYIFVPLRRGADRAGAVLATGDDRDDALARARRAAERIRFVTADAEALIS